MAEPRNRTQLSRQSDMAEQATRRKLSWQLDMAEPRNPTPGYAVQRARQLAGSNRQRQQTAVSGRGK